MPAPTLIDFFGATAAVDTTNPANPKLVLSFTDFADQGFANTGKASDPEAWLAAIVKRARAYTQATTDELSNVTIDAPFRALTTRNNVEVREYQYALRFYEPDTGNTEPDPDNV